MKVKPYLVLNGNAEEAANHYAEILGGKIENLTRYADCIGMGDCMLNIPENHKQKIVHLCLILGDESMGMADAAPGTTTTFGTGNIITLDCDNEKQISTIYAALSEGGQIRCPLQSTFYAKLYADFIDRYGVSWCLMLE